MSRIDPRTRNLAFTDVETTGLNPYVHEIISLAVVVRSPEGETLHRREWFMHPRWPTLADSKSFEINGYTHASWEGRGVVSHETAMREFCEVCEGAIFVAHNVPFDWGMLEQEWERHADVKWTGDYHKVDTVSLAWRPYIELGGKMKSVSLHNVCAYYGISNEGSHNAMVDVDRMVQAYDCMMEESWSLLFAKVRAKVFTMLRSLWSGPVQPQHGQSSL